MSSAESYLLELESRGARIHKPANQLGGNSVLYRVSIRRMKYVIKFYQGDQKRILRSREREISALQFLDTNSFKRAPKIYVDLSPDDGICMEFIKGTPPKQDLRTSRAIMHAILRLKSLFKTQSQFPHAVDACFSTQDVIDQIEERIPALQSEIGKRFAAYVEDLKSREVIEFPRTTNTYSFSDVGSHNMISRFGRYWFLDMEFFGEDSAVKMIADYLIHPRNELTQESVNFFIDIGCEEFGIDREMLLLSIPFFAAKWATIVARRIKDSNAIKPEVKINLDKYLKLSSLRTSTSIHKEILNLR